MIYFGITFHSIEPVTLCRLIRKTTFQRPDIFYNVLATQKDREVDSERKFNSSSSPINPHPLQQKPLSTDKVISDCLQG